MTIFKITVVVALLSGYLWGVETTKDRVHEKLAGVFTAFESVKKAN